MKTRKLFLGLAAMIAASTSFTSCSNEDELGARPSDGRTPITLTSNIATRTVNTALQEDKIAQGVQVGVFVSPTEAGELIADNAQITSDGDNGFTGTIGNYPTGEGATVGIYAYAPYNSAWTGKLSEPQAFTVKTDQTADADYLASDLLYGTPENNQVAASQTAVPVKFTHKLTKINLAFNTDGSDVELKGAAVSLVNVFTQTTINLSTGDLGTSTQQADIAVAKFDGDTDKFTASAIIVPQTVAANANFVRVQLANGTTYDANISTNYTFDTGKVYTYTATFTEEGLELKLQSNLEGWDDDVEDPSGSTEEKIVYGVGDYITSDGTFIKNEDLAVANDETKNKIVAVIFSKDVSDADAAQYDAYAMGLWRVKGKLGFTTELNAASDHNAAFADLDGLTNTSDLLSSDEYTNLEDGKGITMLNVLKKYRTDHSVANATNVSSDWFIPAFGQLAQLVNGLGDAGINASLVTTGEGGTSSNWNSPMWEEKSDFSVLEAINKYATDCGKGEPLTVGSINVVSSTTAPQNFWGIQVRGDSNSGYTSWGFGRGYAQNGQSDLSIIPCVAVKLPESVSSVD